MAGGPAFVTAAAALSYRLITTVEVLLALPGVGGVADCCRILLVIGDPLGG